MKKLIAILFTLVASFFAQEGSIVGRIYDASTHEALIGANIVVIDHKTGDATDLDGYYKIENLPVGSYSLKYSSVGYKSIIKNRVIVKAGKPTVIDIELTEQIGKSDEIVVRASYFEKTKDAAVSSRNMDYEEIAIQPGSAQDIQRAVQALPSVVSAADTENEIIVRGGNYGENLFMIDGIEIPNPNHFAFQGAGGGSITAIYNDFISEVDFIAGAFPAKYGDKASSVLDIKLREGLRDRLHLSLDLGMHGVGGVVEGPLLSDKGSFMIAAHKSFLELIHDAWGLTAIPKYWNTQAKTVYDFNPRLSFSTFALYGDDIIEIHSDEEENIPDPLESYIFEGHTFQYTLGGTLKKIFKSGYTTITLSSTQNNWRQQTTDSTGNDLYYRNHSTETSNTLKGEVVYVPFGSNEITAGAFGKLNLFDYELYEKNDTLYIYEPGTDSIIGSTEYTTGEERYADSEALEYGAYVQYLHNFGPYAYTNIGIRFDGSEYTGNSYISPRLSFTYRLAQDTDVSVAYGRHYQSPESYMLAFNGDDTKLDHYYTDQAVIGIDHLFAEDIRATVEGYYKSYDDGIIPISRITPDPFDLENYFVNAVEGYSKGVELFLQKKVKENLWGTLSYSYSVAKTLDPRSEFYADSSYNPYGYFPKGFDYRHVLTGVLGYRYDFLKQEWYHNVKDKLWFQFVGWLPGMPADESEYSISARYLGPRPYTKPEYMPEYRKWVVHPDKKYNQNRMPEYKTVAIHFNSRWFSGNNINVSSYFELSNAFNTKNVWDYIYQSNGERKTIYQRGRMFVGGLMVEF